MSIEKINKFIKKIHSKFSLENINGDDPSLLQYNFGNIMICNNELNISDDLKGFIQYVRLPYNKYDNPPKPDTQRFNFIKKALSQTIPNTKEFTAAISKYNSVDSEDDNFYKNIKQYEAHYPEEAVKFYKDILPFIIEQALKLPEYITVPIPVMRKYMNIALTFNKLQVLSLIANQFLCTFEEKTHDKYDTPMCSFIILIGSLSALDSSVEKLRCIIHYFDKMRQRDLESLKSELITYQRVSLEQSSLPDWPNVKKELCEIKFDETRIEDCQDMLKLNCGNSYIGGSVLINRCFIEEITFSIYPELFPAMIFIQRLDYTESAFVMGVERFSKYTGIDDTFKYDGDYNDETPIGESKRRKTEIAAIDPYYYTASTYYDQFSKKEVLRELNKLYSGFKTNEYTSLKDSYIATTHWGTVNYNGDPELTFILQILAASVAGRKLNYCKCRCGQSEPMNNVENFLELLKDNEITTDKLFKFLRSYRHEIVVDISNNKPPEFTLSKYISHKILHHQHQQCFQCNNESFDVYENDESHECNIDECNNFFVNKNGVNAIPKNENTDEVNINNEKNDDINKSD